MMDRTANILPCPFCGNVRPYLARDYDPDTGGFFAFVKCGNCGTKGGDKYVSAGNDCPQFYEEIRGAWNNRKAEPQRDIVKALQDFQKWRDARHPDRSDLQDLAEEYAQDCASGAWTVEP